MKILKKVWLLTLLTVCSIPFAGANDGRLGNGADSVVCQNGIDLLDFYEMKEQDLDIQLPGDSLEKKVAVAVNRLKKVDAVRASWLHQYSMEIVADAVARMNGIRQLKSVNFTDSNLYDIRDSYEIMLPRGCSLKQFIVQVNPGPNEKRYMINAGIWDSLDLDQQALTVLHEAWYRIFLSEGASDSRFARYMNRFFSSQLGQKLSLKEYLDMLNYAKVVGSFGGQGIYYYQSIKGIMFKLETNYKMNANGTISMPLLLNKTFHYLSRTEALFSNSGQLLEASIISEDEFDKMAIDRLNSLGV